MHLGWDGFHEPWSGSTRSASAQAEMAFGFLSPSGASDPCVSREEQPYGLLRGLGIGVAE